MADVVTIREAVTRAKAEGLPITENTLRRWVKSGAVPVRKAGNKQLIYFPNLGGICVARMAGIIAPPRWRLLVFAVLRRAEHST